MGKTLKFSNGSSDDAEQTPRSVINNFGMHRMSGLCREGS